MICRMALNKSKEISSAANQELLREINEMRTLLNRWQASYNNIERILETEITMSEQSAEIIEELEMTGLELCKLAANEIKALQNAVVFSRLDRDNWKTDYEKERHIADLLYDALYDSLMNGNITKEFFDSSTARYLLRRK